MIIIRGGKVVDYATDMDQPADIVIDSGKIREIVNQGSIPEKGDFTVVDARGLHVVPGFIDLHVHLREPGYEWKEDIESGSKAAAAGGFSSVVCMANTDPVNDSPEVTRFIREKAKKVGYAKVYPVAALTKGLRGKELCDYGELASAGAIAFSDDGMPVMNAQVMMRAMDYTKMLGARLILHEEDRHIRNKGMVNEGNVSTELGLSPYPSVSEDVLVSRDILLAEYTGASIHIAHVSTARSVELIREGKRRGVDLTAETAPHYLTLTEDSVRGFNTYAKMNPPLRREEDRQALIEGIFDGTIDCVATDHAPHEELVKKCEFQEASYGILGLQTAFPLLNELCSERGRNIKDIVKLLSFNPSQILNIPGGSIDRGLPADLTLLNLESRYIFDEEMNLSKSRNSPFMGKELVGEVVATIVDGIIKFSGRDEVQYEKGLSGA